MIKRTFEIMPRDPNAMGLYFQAGIYEPLGGMHNLICEAYQAHEAENIKRALNAYPELIALVEQLGDALAASLRGVPVRNADELFVRAALVLAHAPEETPGASIEAARRHHAEHGDMDGHTCLLGACALHYPQAEKKST